MSPARKARNLDQARKARNLDQARKLRECVTPPR